MTVSRTGVRAPSWTRALVGIGRGLAATSQQFVEAFVVLVSAGAMGRVGVYAMGVVSGAVVVRGRVCVRSAQKGEPPPGRCLVRRRRLWRSHGRKELCSTAERVRRRNLCGARFWNGERWRGCWRVLCGRRARPVSRSHEPRLWSSQRSGY